MKCIQVTAGDGLPFLLCILCQDKLNNAYEFKKQCEKSDCLLRELTNQSKPKEEMIVKPDVEEMISANNDDTDDYDRDDDEDDCDDDDEGDDGDSEYGDDSSSPKKKRKRGRPKKKTNPFKCEYCHKHLQTLKGLRVHKRKHTGEKLSVCFICKSKFTRTNHLIRHLGTHDKSNFEHSCNDCEFKTTVACEMHHHIKIHNKSDVDCNVNTTKMKNHTDNDDDDDDDESLEKLNEKNKDKALYECKECSKVMTTYVGLQIHMRRHTGNGLVSCNVTFG